MSDNTETTYFIRFPGIIDLTNRKDAILVKLIKEDIQRKYKVVCSLSDKSIYGNEVTRLYFDKIHDDSGEYDQYILDNGISDTYMFGDFELMIEGEYDIQEYNDTIDKLKKTITKAIQYKGLYDYKVDWEVIKKQHCENQITLGVKAMLY